MRQFRWICFALFGSGLGVSTPALADLDNMRVLLPGATPPVAALPAASLLAAEQGRMSALLASHDIRRLAGLPETEDHEAPLDALAAHGAIEADAVEAIGDAIDRTATALLIADRDSVPDEAALARIEVGAETPEWRCMAEGLYFEARGESVLGQIAVGEVILNRVDSRSYPDTVCGVLEQGAHRLNACQFSYNCDGQDETIHEPKAWEQVGKVAWLMLQGRPRTITDKATHYHTTAVSPSWAQRLVKTARIGEHLFYRPAVTVSQR
ncbi:MAG: cell wall hydrolase [Pseudomonadota bacterium]